MSKSAGGKEEESASSLPLVVVNIAGEGEVADALNVNGYWIRHADWRVSRDGRVTLQNLLAAGHRFIIADNARLPFADGSIDFVYTNNVLIDGRSHLGLYPQEAEIRRILKPGGKWIHDDEEQP